MDNWYKPLKMKKNKTRRTGLIIVILTIVAALIALYFTLPLGIDELMPDNPDGNAGQKEEMPESAFDFFKQYYTSTSTDSVEINIPVVDDRGSFSIEFAPAAEEEPLSLSDLYEKCSGTIVGIKGYLKEDSDAYAWGTGVIVSNDGIILTNTHVIEDCVKAEVVLFNDKEYEAKLIGADSISDLALLKIDAINLKPAVFGDSSVIKVGEDVAAIGNPLGDRFCLTMTNGIVSAIDRGIDYKGHSMTLIQTNTALNEGNSGGALFNMYGQVIGITNMKMMSAYNSIEGIGFAIPSSVCKNVCDALVKNGKVEGRASVGITVGAIPDSAKDIYSLPDGLYVMDVVENSDAFKQGIKPGDVVTAVNGKTVTTTAEVNEMKNDLGVGDEMIFTIYRDGKTMDITIKLMDSNDIYG